MGYLTWHSYHAPLTRLQAEARGLDLRCRYCLAAPHRVCVQKTGRPSRGMHQIRVADGREGRPGALLIFEEPW